MLDDSIDKRKFEMKSSDASIFAFMVSILLYIPMGIATPVVTSAYSISLFANNIGAADGMTLDQNGDLLVTDYDGGRVLIFEKPFSNIVNDYTVYASGIAYPTDIITSSDDRVFVTSGSTGQIIEIASNGTTSVFAAGLTNPTAITSIGSTLYVANSGAGTISTVDHLGDISTYISGYQSGNGPFGIDADASGNIYFTEHISGDIYRASSSTTIDLLGSLPSTNGAAQLAYSSSEELFISDSSVGAIYLLQADGSLSIFADGFEAKANAPFIGPTGIVLDESGNMLVGDGDSIWLITAVPIPASAWLFGSAFAGLILARKKQS